jgi:hypothetical protein
MVPAHTPVEREKPGLKLISHAEPIAHNESSRNKDEGLWRSKVESAKAVE